MSAGPDDPDSLRMSALLDRFSRVDDLLEDANEQLSDLSDGVSDLPDALNAQQNALASLADAIGVDSGIEVGKEFPFPLSAYISADTSYPDQFVTEFDVPYDARVSRVVIECDDAAQQGLGVKIGTGGGETWIPGGGGIKIGSSTTESPEFMTIPTRPITVRPNTTVNSGNPIRAQYVNNDPNNPHWATVVVFLREM